MEIQSQQQGNVDILEFQGRLDATGAKAAKSALKELTDANRARIVIDMSGVDFIDSTGIGALIGALRTAKGLGGDVVVAGLLPATRAIFELTRLHRVFSILDDREAAIKSLADT